MRLALFLSVGVVAAVLLLPHECADYQPTGRTIDARIIEDPVSGRPVEGPLDLPELPEVRCSRYDERLPLRAVAALGIALVVAWLGWDMRRREYPSFGDYLRGP